MSHQLDPTSIMQTATSFWASKVLLTAVEFDLFSTLGDGSMTAEQLGGRWDSILRQIRLLRCAGRARFPAP